MIERGLPGKDWDKLIESQGGHAYQSSHWAAFQIAQGREVLRDSADGWSWLGAVRTGRGGFKYFYSAYGPTIKGPSDLAPAIQSITAAAKGLDFVRIEPMGGVDDEQLMHQATATKPTQPKNGMYLDLTPSDDKLRGQISQSNRNLINQAEARGLSFEVSHNPDDVEDFIAMQRETAGRAHFSLQPDEYFRVLAKTMIDRGVGHLWFARHKDHGRITAALGWDFGGTRYYTYAGAKEDLNREHKAFIAMVWWIIADAKKAGLKKFDFGGVAPPDQPNHPWAGHTRFKESLGGVRRNYHGTWEIGVSGARYGLYRLAKRVAR